MKLRQLSPAALVLGLACLNPGVAVAAPAMGSDFQIQYWTTDANGERGRQMTQNDLQGYVNKARCECGQGVYARVRLQADQMVDNTQIRTFVGNNCDTGQLGNTLQNRPCALVINDFTNAYTRNIDFTFNPLWLTTGVSGQDQAIETAVASRGCDTQQGDGGIWICVEDGEQSECQPSEFVTTGAQTQIVDPDTGTGSSLSFDFLPPTVSATNFRAAGGDGSVLIKWDASTFADIQGFRVLCANEDGSPVDGKGYRQSSITTENRGTIYYTAENLCPEGPFDTVEVTDMPPPLPSDPGGGDSDGDTDGGSTGGALEFEAPPEVWADHIDEPCCGMGLDCDDLGCVADVSRVLPSCSESWDDACVAEAHSVCATCGGAGLCCTANGTASCRDEGCALAVCAEADFASCCNGTWSQSCAEQARDVCGDTCDMEMPVDETTGGATSDSGTTTGGSSSTTMDTDGPIRTSGADTDDVLDTSAIRTLDWAYVCSDFVGFSATSARIDGLTNDRNYQILLVAFDRAGNPVEASDVLTATPRETTDFWEQCDEQGEVCGKGGFCSCTTDGPSDGLPTLLGLALLGLGVRRRRRLA